MIWAGLGLAAFLVCPWTVWGIYAWFAVRVVALVEGLFRLSRATSEVGWWNARSGVATGAAVASYAFLKTFVAVFSIPSVSMAPTLVIGDYISAESMTLLWRAPERGEVVVFHVPCKPERDYVKRVIAVANDTVEIRCNVLYVNGKAVPSEHVEGEGMCVYRDRRDLTGAPEFEPADQWVTQPCSRYRETLDGRSYEVFHDVGRPERDAKAKQGAPAEGNAKDFPSDELMTCDDVPAEMGGPSAAQQPGKLVETKPNASACEPQRHFVVPPDSLFVLGDNRNNANDSRYWGVVPIDYVTGRVVGVWRPLAQARDL